MTKEITKAIILQQIQDKLKLRELEPGRFTFSEEVIPTYNIEPHIQEQISEIQTVSVTSGPTAYEFFEVPDDERWVLNRYNIVFMAAGAYKVTGMYILRGSGNAIYLDMIEGQTVSYAVELHNPSVLDAGHKLFVYVDDYTSTANLRVYIDYEREVIR